MRELLTLFTLSVTFLIISCKKNDEMKNTIKDETIEKLKVVNQTFSQNRLSNSLPEFEEIPQSAAEIFQNIDHVHLQSMINTQSEDMNDFIIDLADDVKNYVLSVYQYDMSQLSVTPSETVYIGLFYAALESGELNNLQIPNSKSIKNGGIAVEMSGNESCFYAVLGGFIGIRDVMSIVGAYRNAVSAQTVIAMMRFALGRVVTVFAVGMAVYGLGDCLDWW